VCHFNNKVDSCWFDITWAKSFQHQNYICYFGTTWISCFDIKSTSKLQLLIWYHFDVTWTSNLDIINIVVHWIWFWYHLKKVIFTSKLQVKEFSHNVTKKTRAKVPFGQSSSRNGESITALYEGGPNIEVRAPHLWTAPIRGYSQFVLPIWPLILRWIHNVTQDLCI
jgi:hypothetical protein